MSQITKKHFMKPMHNDINRFENKAELSSKVHATKKHANKARKKHTDDVGNVRKYQNWLFLFFLCSVTEHISVLLVLLYYEQYKEYSKQFILNMNFGNYMQKQRRLLH